MTTRLRPGRLSTAATPRSMQISLPPRIHSKRLRRSTPRQRRRPPTTPCPTRSRPTTRSRTMAVRRTTGCTGRSYARRFHGRKARCRNGRRPTSRCARTAAASTIETVSGLVVRAGRGQARASSARRRGRDSRRDRALIEGRARGRGPGSRGRARARALVTVPATDPDRRATDLRHRKGSAAAAGLPASIVARARARAVGGSADVSQLFAPRRSAATRRSGHTPPLAST